MAGVLLAGVFLLPLVCWPGLEHPFSTPKIWLLACLDLGLACSWLLGRENAPPAPHTGDWPLLAWLAAVGLSALLASYAALPALLLAVLPVPLWWAVRQGLLPADRVRLAVLGGSAAESAIVLLQYAHLDPLRALGWQPETFLNPRMRVYGTLGNPDFVAAWLSATLPLYAAPAKRHPVLAWAAVGLQLAAILATGSRVFLLTLPVALAVLACRRMRLERWWLAGLPVAAALLWFSPARPLGVTVEGRLYFAQVAAGHWRQVPLTGFGPGSFGLQFARWQVEWLSRHGPSRFAGELDHAHNDYLELFVEYGPVGFGAFLLLCGWLMREAWRKGALAAHGGIWAALASLLAVACVDFPFHRPAEWGLYWLLLGMLARGKIY